jgi:crotonobetainyl-CoA:carnitine CoA-transferase CaiB-like acyl-CoA transferase
MLSEIQLPGDNPAMKVVGTPIKFARTPAGVYRRPPLLGEHTEEVLAEAGISIPSKEKQR